MCKKLYFLKVSMERIGRIIPMGTICTISEYCSGTRAARSLAAHDGAWTCLLENRMAKSISIKTTE